MITIDLERLRREAAELQSQLTLTLAAIQLIEKLGVEKDSHPMFSKTNLLEPLPVAKLERPRSGKVTKNGRRPFQQGLQKETLIHLHTGPATEEEIAKVLGKDVRDIRVSLKSSAKHKFVYQEPVGEKWALTGEGKRRAIWFLAHPTYIHYTHGIK